MSLLKALKQQTQGVPKHLVFVLDIMAVAFKKFDLQSKAFIQQFPNLQMLTLNDCQIQSLQNFPHIPSLIRLDLVFNKIQDKDLIYLRGSRHLQTLMLGANNIKNIQSLKDLGQMKQLLQLDLLRNPICKVQNYRQKIFSMFKGLTVLDTLDKSGKDGFDSSTMALAASRVPDNLFDKNVPSAPSGGLFGSAPSNSSFFGNGSVPSFASVPAPSSYLSTLPTTHITASTYKKSRIPLNSISSNPSPVSALPKVQKASKIKKLQKAGKGAKIISVSNKPLFNCGKIRRILRQKAGAGVRVGKVGTVYLSAVLQYLTSQLLTQAGNVTKNDKKVRIKASHIKRSLLNDQQMNKLLHGVTMSIANQ